MLADRISKAINGVEAAAKKRPVKVLVSPEYMQLLLASEGLKQPKESHIVTVDGVPLEVSQKVKTFYLLFE